MAGSGRENHILTASLGRCTVVTRGRRQSCVLSSNAKNIPMSHSLSLLTKPISLKINRFFLLSFFLEGKKEQGAMITSRLQNIEF